MEAITTPKQDQDFRIILGQYGTAPPRLRLFAGRLTNKRGRIKERNDGAVSTPFFEVDEAHVS